MAATELCHESPMEIGAVVRFDQPADPDHNERGVITGPPCVSPDAYRRWCFPVEWDRLEAIVFTPVQDLKFTGYRRR